MGFLHPELLLFALPLAAAWLRFRAGGPASRALQLLAGALLVLALAGPYSKGFERGRDVVIVADRSRSMPADATHRILETIRLAEASRSGGDRVGVVAFGADVKVERAPSAEGSFTGFEQSVNLDGSDLAGAVETALRTIPDGRPGCLLLVSDGESNGPDALAAARRAYGRGVAVFTRCVRRPTAADLTIERLDLPDVVGAGEPFQFTVWVWADKQTRAPFQLERRGKILSQGQRVFEAGLNRLVFRDVLDEGGTAPYRVTIAHDDPVPENNTAIGAVRVEGARSVLIVNSDGAEDTLAAAIRKAGIPVHVAQADAARLDPVSLTAHRAVILENVPVGKLRGGLSGLRDFVTERGGGVMLTGGRAGFGVGGYHKSELDEHLPVSMEMRKEQRKLGMALSIVLDRSGSMAVPVPGGLRKMDLANLGTCAAVELLTPIDSVAVTAVDSAPHVIQPLTIADDIPAITARVRKIESMGGGIFTYTALVAAGKELDNAPQSTKHIILFADTADAEEPGQYVRLLEEYVQAGITVSVIGLGKETDKDSEFLIDVAKRGRGEIYFTTEPNDLPRLFAQDTLTVSRSTFIEQTTPAAILPDVVQLGEVPPGAFPAVDGYNLTYLRPEAVMGVMTTDEYKAPIVAFRHAGLGRTAVFTGQVGGKHGGSIVAWPGFSAFFVTVARWLSGQEEPREYFTSARRDGKDAVVAVEVDASAGPAPDASRLKATVVDETGRNRDVVLQRVGEHRFEGRYPLTPSGVSVGTVQLGEGKVVSLPPLALPYSPEFERPAEPDAGEKLLRRLSAESGGAFDAEIAALFEGERGGRAWRLLTIELLTAALVVLVAEILVRRLALLTRLAVPAPLKRAVTAAASWRPARPAPGSSREDASRQTPAPVAEAAPAAAPVAPAAPVKPTAPVKPAEPSLADALAKARKSAGKETRR
jgi:hypothetical protein